MVCFHRLIWRRGFGDVDTGYLPVIGRKNFDDYFSFYYDGVSYSLLSTPDIEILSTYLFS